MDWSRQREAGSDYTTQASTVVLASLLAAGASGFTAQHLGYAGHFTLALVLGIVAFTAVALLFPRATRSNELPRMLGPRDDERSPLRNSMLAPRRNAGERSP